MNKTKQWILFSLFFISFLHANEIIIRPANVNDISAINNFTNEIFWNHFAPLYSYIIAANDFNNFMQRYIIRQQNAFAEFITKQINQEPYGVIIAEKITAQEQPQLVGCCRFNQKNPQNIHIYFVGIDKNMRRQGIGAQLIHEAINSFANITHCTLRTHAYRNDEAHAFYQKLGFKLIGFGSLNPQTDLIEDNSELPITHATYCLALN